MVGLRRLEAPVQSWRKGPWTAEEDKLLTEHVNLHREGRWSSVARSTGLNRSGKSCRLRWVNYLRPGLKKGQLTPQEEGIIIELHALWGNKWSAIAQCLPGRTDNEIKNYWRTHFKNKEKSIESLEKQRNRILRQQQQQQQQLQQNQQELEQQQQGPEMNMSISQIKEGDERVSQAQGREENMVFMYPSTLEDQCFLPVMFQDFATMSNTLEEEALWDGLWNLYDIHDHVDHTCANNHASNNLYK